MLLSRSAIGYSQGSSTLPIYRFEILRLEKVGLISKLVAVVVVVVTAKVRSVGVDLVYQVPVDLQHATVTLSK
jgi:hypothetical protein